MSIQPLSGPSLVSVSHDGKKHYGIRIYVDWSGEGTAVSFGSLNFIGNSVSVNPLTLGPAGGGLEIKSLVYTQSFINNQPASIGGRNFSGQGGEAYIYTPATGALVSLANPINVSITPLGAPTDPPYPTIDSQVSGVMSFVNSPSGDILIGKVADDASGETTTGISAFTFFDFELPTWSSSGSGLALS